jgi:low temperature requirement protein LtrA
VKGGSGQLSGPGLEPAAPGTRVTWLELFFDLVFVFAFLNVSLTASGDGPAALLRGLLILALLWFAWTTFASLGNIVRADRGIMPAFGFASVAVIFVAGLAIPSAFTQQPQRHLADFVFAGCYLAVRGLQVLGIWYATRYYPHLRPRWLVLSVPPLISSALLLGAAFVPSLGLYQNHIFATQAVLWGLSIAVAYGVSAVVGNRGLPIVSARHWADRYAQVILIALGESFISLGVGPRLPTGLRLNLPVIYGAALGIVVIACLAWAYFDMRSIAGEHALHRVDSAAQIALARDAYTFLHLPMIVGIIAFALGLKEVVAAIANQPLAFGLPAPATDVYLLYGGAWVYMAALLGFQLRTERWADWFQVGSRALVPALIPLATRLPRIGALALLAVGLGVLLVINHVCLRDRRGRLRATALEQERALEATETWWRYGEEEAPSRDELRRRATPRPGP